MPEFVCNDCEKHINLTYPKIVKFNDLQLKWVDRLATHDNNHPYFQVLSVIKVCLFVVELNVCGFGHSE